MVRRDEEDRSSAGGEGPSSCRTVPAGEGAPQDRQLLDAWQRGDQAAGERLVERHYEALVTFFRTKAGNDAADLVQRTFVLLLEARQRMREGTPFNCYLYGIARNVLYAHYRRSRRHRERFQPEETSVEDLGPTPSGVLAEAQEAELLLQALRRIPIEFQIILELFYWEKMTAKELADVLGVPEGTARTRLRRARQLLEGQLAKLARSPQLMKSTLSSLESWAQKLRTAARASPGG